jgi:energy-coupling factor transporter ATP-binding protein EcfA2
MRTLTLLSFYIFSPSLQATSFEEEEKKDHENITRPSPRNSDSDELTRFDIKHIVERHLKENPDLLDSSIGKDIVVFLGITGSGKSTLINYLTDKELMVNESAQIVLRNLSDPTAMSIGEGKESETLLPKFIQTHQGLLFYDLPGFGDNRGPALSLVGASFIKNIIEKARTTRFVFVAAHGAFTVGRGAPFEEFLNNIKNLIYNGKGIDSFSSLVVTQTTPDPDIQRSMERLKNQLRHVTKSGVLEPWISQNQLVQMSSPLGDEINPHQKAEILEAIKRTPPIEIVSIDISNFHNNQTQQALRNIYHEEIDDVVNQVINRKFDVDKISSSFDETRLEANKQYFQGEEIVFEDINSELQTSSLIRLLRPISEGTYRSSWDEKKREISDRLGNIVEKLNKQVNFIKNPLNWPLEERERIIHSETFWGPEKNIRFDCIRKGSSGFLGIGSYASKYRKSYTKDEFKRTITIREKIARHPFTNEERNMGIINQWEKTEKINEKRWY